VPAAARARRGEERTAEHRARAHETIAHYIPPTLVVATLIGSEAGSPPPPAIVSTHEPAATGVTANDVALVAATVTMPLHDVAFPAAAVVALNKPLKFACVAVTVCAYAGPVATNVRLDGVTITVPGVGTGDGLGSGERCGKLTTFVPPPHATSTSEHAAATGLNTLRSHPLIAESIGWLRARL
jgi:hypothetical protein